MAKTTLKPCKCKSSYQDDRYKKEGEHMRVHNVAGQSGGKGASKGKTGTCVCTVCGDRKSV